MAPIFPRIGRCGLLFVLIGVLVRTPLFLPLTLYDDEHTFINMVYDVAHGYLPYKHLWDNKPPLMFLLLAPLVILSHHLWVIRLAAAMLDTFYCLNCKSHLRSPLWRERCELDFSNLLFGCDDSFCRWQRADERNDSSSSHCVRNFPAIMRIRPTWIVFGDQTQWKYATGTEVGNVIQPILSADYMLVPSPNQREIYHLVRDR
jgi:hypothetical protein